VYHESCKVVIFISFCSFSRWEQSEIACLGSSVYPPSLLYTPIHTHTHSSTHIFGFEIHRWNKLCLQMVITKIKGFVCLILNYNVLCIKCTFVTISKHQTNPHWNFLIFKRCRIHLTHFVSNSTLQLTRFVFPFLISNFRRTSLIAAKFEFTRYFTPERVWVVFSLISFLGSV